MNIFEYIAAITGDPCPARPENKVTQLVKHMEEVPDSKIPDRLICMEKKDGISCLMVVYDSVAEFFTRTGRVLTSTKYLSDNLKELLKDTPDGVYAGELCTYQRASLEELGGVVNPNRVNPLTKAQELIAKGLHLATFDYVTIEQFVAGKTVGFPRIERVKFLRYNVPSSIHLFRIEAFFVTKECTNAEADRWIAKGSEGVVYSCPREEWIAGHKGFHQMKVVRGIHLDLICQGVVWGVGKFAGMIGGLNFLHKEKPFTAGLGKGWDYPRMKRETEAYQRNSKNIVGELWHVYGLQESSKGVIRLPKVAEKRVDKTIPD